jgi:glycosyltransferase involved in cell wall biosynthesis
MPEAWPLRSRVGVVAIARNEGGRLARCLASVLREASRVVYVDSGSTDGSLERARAMGVETVALDSRLPFTAARARNAGLRRLLELEPALPFVQFVDGDCEIVAGWLERAVAFLDARREVVVVCGRRRERFPERSAYNLLCDMEWDTPPGEALACGGDALARAAVLARAGGFREDLIAGEEPELCARLRAAGWQVWRLPVEMTLHDAAMTRFSQWWRRTRRAGHAFAEVASLCRALPGRPWRRESLSNLVWGAALPASAFAGAWLFGPAALAVLCLYPLQVARIAVRGDRSPRENWLRALAIVAGKLPEALGHLQYLASRAAGERARLIEYK